jgi:saccharopine dehydrogenase (NADP+, L-glutamate forming)
MGTQILVIGAGKSATMLIQYLQKKVVENDWYMVLADSEKAVAVQKWNNAKNGHAVELNVENEADRKALIEKATIVVSMMPAFLHFLVAKDCLLYCKPLFTASYVDDNMRSIAQEIKDKNLLFLCEMGLDPGIDHMSAMELIHRIKKQGGVITGFKSHCGGLIAPESDNNPWHYKISWNPRNIILAGKSGAIFLEKGIEKEIEYKQLFASAPTIDVPGIGQLAYYPNRNSLSYIETYDLQGVSDFVRTTLRYPEFCKGWNAIVQLGLTAETITPSDALRKQNANGISVASWFENYLKENALETMYAEMQKDAALKVQLNFIGLEEATIIPTELNNSAEIIQWLLEQKWVLAPQDKDMVVMMHEVTYTLANEHYLVQSSMVLIGQNAVETAMAKTVGLPLAMGVCAYLKGDYHLTGLHIPIDASIYTPILKSLAEEGIVFEEKVTKL